MEKPGETAGTVLVAVSGGKGLVSKLKKHGIHALACKNLAELSRRFDDSTDAIILAEETLPRPNPLRRVLAAQPPWSDVSLILLSKPRRKGKKASQLPLESLGDANVTVLPTPLRIVALLSALQAAARTRQHHRADISDRMEQQKRLRENEQRLYVAEERIRLALEAADVGTFDHYPTAGVIRWSDRCNELFGLAAGTKPGYATYLEAIHPDDRHIIHEAMREVLSPGSSGHYEIQYRAIRMNDSGECWLEEKGRVLLDDAGRPARFLGTIRDITQRKQAEDALKKAKQDAEDANRAKDQFLAMLSHELRTPLTPVLMTIASLQRNHDIPDNARRDLEVLRRNVELEALLIDDLLDLTRIAHGKLELRNDAIDVHAALTYALGVSASDLNEKQINVRQNFAAKEHHCWADAARLQQVFWNIIKNAVKFTPARGQLLISTRNDSEHYIIIDFTDTGIGINRELQPRIFDAFEQGGSGVTNRYGGLGLGLAISKRVIDLHGGKISVQSEGQGTGATFTIKLKAMETSLLEGPAYPLDYDGALNATANILLVEDHEDTARALRRMLENAGYQVGYASSLASARDLAAKRRFQLVISDLGLPDGSGLDLMGELGDSGQLRGIALSGFGSENDVAAAKAAVFAAHFTKPVDWERLRYTIHRLLDGRPRR